MKDYYDILGIQEGASPDEIRSAFRRLAFEHHPDKNPGNEKWAEERFKEISEAYGVLGDEAKRREYDAFRQGRLAGVGQGGPFQGFRYTQEDIFRNAFSQSANFEELNRMFAQAGLRFDEDFLNRVLFGGRGFHFQFYSDPDSVRRTHHRYGPTTEYSTESFPPRGQPVVRKPSLIERMLSRAATRLVKYLLKKVFDIDFEPLPPRGQDLYQELTISPKEAGLGCQKQVRYQRGQEEKVIEVTVPPGIVPGKKIRLRGMGLEGREPGDLYLRVKVK